MKLYCKILGYDYDILKNETQRSKSKVVFLANSLMIPVIMWSVMGFLIPHCVMKTNLYISIISSVICGLLIFSIERQILMAGKSILTTLLRIFLGIFIAALGSIGFDEIIFEGDIDKQVELNKTEYIQTEKNKRIVDFQNEVQILKQEKNDKYLTWQKLNDDAIREADGTGGSKQRGYSEIAKMKYNAAEVAKKGFEDANEKFELAEKNLQENANEYASEISNSYNTHSLLTRIKAMFDLIGKDTAMLVVYLIFSFILFLLEFSVIIAKYSFEETSFEKKMKLSEKVVESRIKEMAEIESAMQGNSSQFLSNRYFSNLKKEAPAFF